MVGAMATPISDLEDALARNDLPAARALFDQLAGSGVRLPWMKLAQAAYRAGDAEAEGWALGSLLREDRADVAGLAAMAELQRRQGDSRAASDWYRLLIATASGLPGGPPPQLQPILARAAQFLDETARSYTEHFVAALRDQGIEGGSASPRIRHALDLLTGQASLYLQQPSMFYFPGLPQRAFYEREEFAWVPAFEAKTGAIRAELEALIGSGDEGFAPYVAAAPGRPAPNNPLLDDPSWGACHVLKNGAPVAGISDRCPATMAALAAAPQPVIPNRSPMALFSRLRPGTHIKPHHGMLNTRLICHLPLIVPEGCALRAGAETRPWVPGQMILFDDSFEHEAWNRGESDRVVLLFEVWKPEIDSDEREILARLFAAIDLYED
jgi:aspartyl/asparaginyl beta-hydroxylase (cupin superfamily)